MTLGERAFEGSEKVNLEVIPTGGVHQRYAENGKSKQDCTSSIDLLNSCNKNNWEPSLPVTVVKDGNSCRGGD